MSKTTTETNVSQVTLDLDEILGTPGAENIITATSDLKKPNIFSNGKVDMKFVNEESTEEIPVKPEIKNDQTKPAATDAEVTEVLSTVPGELFAKGKTETAALFQKFIKAGKLVPFDDDKKIEDYSDKDYEELLEANMAEREQKIRQQTPVEFFQSLPEEMQVAAKYIADGGRDIKGLFQALAQTEEIRDLDVADPTDHETIVRNYLRATNYGNEEDIDEEITGLKDRSELQNKAIKYKPKLEMMQETIIAQKLAKQEQMREQQAHASNTYMQNIYRTLEPGVLNGVRLDKKTQNMLYEGLVSPRYPSISGRPTNLLGHLLEKYQYVEPNHSLITETLWLLADPDGFKNKLREQGKNGAIEKTVRQLKTEEQNRDTDSPVIEKDEASTRRIPRNNNFFKR